MINFLRIVNLCLIIVIFSGGYVIKKGYKLGINTTKSEPYGIYLLMPIRNDAFNVGQMVAFDKPKINWITSREYITYPSLLLKKIGAKPGEWLFTKNNTVYVCLREVLTTDCKVLGKCLVVDSRGRPIVCHDWNAYEIPIGKYYLQSDYINTSLDSRYFGLINKSNIKYKAVGIIVW